MTLIKLLDDPLRARRLLAVYWVALAVGSHWPRLSLFPPPEHEWVFQPDKGLHFIAFAGLTWLMVRARIAGLSATPAWTAAVTGCLALLYAGLDELAQHWAQRQVTFSDFTASAIGVLTIMLVVSTKGRPAPHALVIRLARSLWLVAVVGVLVLALPVSGSQMTQRLLAQFTATWGGIDKLCHFFAAMVMTWLLALAFPAGARRSSLGVWTTILVMGLSAPMIETAQSYTGRAVETADIFAHELGLFAAMGVWALISTGRALRAAGIIERYE